MNKSKWEKNEVSIIFKVDEKERKMFKKYFDETGKIVKEEVKETLIKHIKEYNKNKKGK